MIERVGLSVSIHTVSTMLRLTNTAGKNCAFAAGRHGAALEGGTSLSVEINWTAADAGEFSQHTDQHQQTLPPLRV